MPILDGYETTVKIREMENELRSYIIGLSAHTEAFKQACFDSGMDDFSKIYIVLQIFIVSKPLSTDKLKEVLI